MRRQYNGRSILRVYALVVLVSGGMNISLARAQPVFSESFEGGLAAWTGQNGGGHSGQIVADPLRSGNNVLTFSQLANGGDMYGPLIGGGEMRFQFEYLGLAKAGSVPDNFGGFLGYHESTNPAAGSMWMAGTQAGYNGGTPLTVVHLVDDGQWHAYDITLTPIYSNIRVIIQDWVGAGGVAGDAYFDNIHVTRIPEPSGVALAMVVAFAIARRRDRLRLSGEGPK